MHGKILLWAHPCAAQIYMMACFAHPAACLLFSKISGEVCLAVNPPSPATAYFGYAFGRWSSGLDDARKMAALPTGLYNFAWSGGTFEVQLRARGIFWCPQFPAAAQWAFSAETQTLEIDWGKVHRTAPLPSHTTHHPSALQSHTTVSHVVAPPTHSSHPPQTGARSAPHRTPPTPRHATLTAHSGIVPPSPVRPAPLLA